MMDAEMARKITKEAEKIKEHNALVKAQDVIRSFALDGRRDAVVLEREIYPYVDYVIKELQNLNFHVYQKTIKDPAWIALNRNAGIDALAVVVEW